MASGSVSRTFLFFNKSVFSYSSLLGYFFLILFALLSVATSQRSVKPHFECPQQFGYFQDLSDCNKYYICVFGDALHDKCTPGLYFNNELRMCDWPRNVKNCDGSGTSDDDKQEIVNRRTFGNTTPKPRTSGRSRSSSGRSRGDDNNEEIINLNSISPPRPTKAPYQSRTRYTPPINSESYVAASRNATHVHYRPVSSFYSTALTVTPQKMVPSTTTTTTPRPQPASFKPVTQRPTPRPESPDSREESRASILRTKPSSSSSSNKRKDYDDSEYYEDDYEDSIPAPKLYNRDAYRGGNNVYVTPIDPNPSMRPRYFQSLNYNTARYSGTTARPMTYRPRNSMSDRQRDINSNRITTHSYAVKPTSAPVLTTFHFRGRTVDKNAVRDSNSMDRKPTVYTYNRNSDPNRPNGYTAATVGPRGPPYIEQADGSMYKNSNSNNNALSSTYTSRPRDSDSSIRLRPEANNRGRSYQSLNNGGDSLDAQFGTNPRAISLPDAPYRQNSFLSSSEDKKAERNQHRTAVKPQLQPPPAVRYQVPSRPSYQQDVPGSDEDYDDDYAEYYYDDDDEYYDDDDDDKAPGSKPKVIIRVQKPSTTSTTTTQRPVAPPTTRRPTTTTTTTTRRPAITATKAAKRPLPVGISRPAAKRPISFGPKPLPRLPSRPPAVYSTPQPMTLASKCSPSNCALPDCRCGGIEIPGGLKAQQVPQIVLITFDDAVNDLNYELYAELFDNRFNPNGCPILGTFYVSHEWTDYGMVQSLYSKGHEMASHSITHSHGEKFSVNSWTKEISGQREILHLYGGVKLEDIRGMRAPFLQVGGNSMFEMLYHANFTYDSSMPVLDNNPPFYPYTLDYKLNHECMIPPCPTKSFPGLWEVGMVMWNDYRGGRCSMGDACANPDNAEDVYKMLLKNFNRHYESNRAPFGLFYHAAWFTTQHYRRGYMKFIEHINSKDDVYMVTNWQAIQWMRDPTPLSHIKSFEPFQCPKNHDRPGLCHHPKSCSISYKGGNRNMRTCQPCPSTFPWTGKTGFQEVYGKQN